MATGKVRGFVYTQQEKDILKKIVAGFAKIIENKRTDALSSKQKDQAWVRVATAFNSYPNVTRRLPEQLRQAWKNMKSLEKKQALTLRRMATADGPPAPDPPEDPLGDASALHTVDPGVDALLRLSAGRAIRSAAPPTSFGCCAGTDADADAGHCFHRERQEAHTSDLAVAARQRDELHEFRVREARAAAEAAESRAEFECIRALWMREQLDYERQRRPRSETDGSPSR